VTPNSPSLTSGQLPGNSGADVFFDPAPQVPGLQWSVPYARAQSLGLRMGDDINALIVDDFNTNGIFDGNDCVYFSLSADSPSLLLLPFVSSNGAADVLRTCAAPDGIVEPKLYAAAADLGLLGPADDIDALEVVPCGSASDPTNPCDPVALAAASSIRLFAGDWNNNGTIGVQDAGAIPPCLSGPHDGVGFVPPPPICRDIFDFNGDGDVDLKDFSRFAQIFGTAPGSD
jgi:hypothetical protein